jgi:3-phosphoshikimate 1-carboxyvinyltransferase
MERTVIPSVVRGTVSAPSSKSMMQRAIAAGVLAEGETIITNPSYCDDSLAAMGIAVALGAKVEPAPTELRITGTGDLREKRLNCGESGLATRMFSPIAALYPDEIVVSGSGSLKKRPMTMIVEALEQFGVSCTSREGYLPLTIRGPLKGGNCEIDGSISSQLLTGLLMALPVAGSDSQIRVRDLKSKPYIDMTLEVLVKFGITIENTAFEYFRIKGKQKYRACRFAVEGDWSGASFVLVAGAVNGSVTVKGLQAASRQSDKAVLSALDKAGASLSISDNEISVKSATLKSFEFDATDSPDLFPPLAALAANCRGVSGIKGVSRLIHKESNRAKALVDEFGKMNINIEINGDYMLITGGKVHGTRVESHDDHRIAMAVAVASLKAEERTSIRDSHCIAKSYPGFFNDLRQLGVEVLE